jgi:hypothetical protein
MADEDSYDSYEDSEPSGYGHSGAEKYLAWFEAKYGPQKRAWPGLVGDCPERVAAIVRYGSPYFVVVKQHKRSLKASIADELQWSHPLRVVLQLDKDGFVAKTPRVG